MAKVGSIIMFGDYRALYRITRLNVDGDPLEVDLWGSFTPDFTISKFDNEAVMTFGAPRGIDYRVVSEDGSMQDEKMMEFWLTL